MAIPDPDRLFDRLAPCLPGATVWVWRVGAGMGFLAAAVTVALGLFWAGGIALLIAVLAAGVGQALARRDGLEALPVLSLGLLLIPFGFAIAEPVRALAAMFLMLALSVLTVLTRGHVSLVTWLVAAAFLIACFFPSYFSILAYIFGIIVFIAAGQGAVQGQT
jgi:hypothetical protein